MIQGSELTKNPLLLGYTRTTLLNSLPNILRKPRMNWSSSFVSIVWLARRIEILYKPLTSCHFETISKKIAKSSSEIFAKESLCTFFLIDPSVCCYHGHTNTFFVIPIWKKISLASLAHPKSCDNLYSAVKLVHTFRT